MINEFFFMNVNEKDETAGVSGFDATNFLENKKKSSICSNNESDDLDQSGIEMRTWRDGLCWC